MIIFDKFDIRISLRDGKYFMRYDQGTVATQYTEMEISKEDAERVMEDINYSLQLVWDYRNRERGLL